MNNDENLYDKVCRRFGIRLLGSGRRLALEGRGRRVIWYPRHCSAFLEGTTHSEHCGTIEAVCALVVNGPAPVRRASR